MLFHGLFYATVLAGNTRIHNLGEEIITKLQEMRDRDTHVYPEARNAGADAYTQEAVGQCPDGLWIESEYQCEAAATALGLDDTDAPERDEGWEGYPNSPYGCYYKLSTDQLIWNPTGNKVDDDTDRVSLCHLPTVCPIDYVKWSNDLTNAEELVRQTGVSHSACTLLCTQDSDCVAYEYESRTNSDRMMCKTKSSYSLTNTNTDDDEWANSSSDNLQHGDWDTCIKVSAGCESTNLPTTGTLSCGSCVSGSAGCPTEMDGTDDPTSSPSNAPTDGSTDSPSNSPTDTYQDAGYGSGGGATCGNVCTDNDVDFMTGYTAATECGADTCTKDLCCADGIKKELGEDCSENSGEDCETGLECSPWPEMGIEWPEMVCKTPGDQDLEGRHARGRKHHARSIKEKLRSIEDRLEELMVGRSDLRDEWN